MRLSPDGTRLFISTMKCATNTVYDALEKIDWMPITKGVHPKPVERLAEIHFTICRNPYDRAVSIWASTCLRDEDRYNAKKHILSKSGDPNKFSDFVRICLDGPITWTPHNWLFSNQTDWYDSMVVDAFCHIENLKPEIESITGPLEISNINVSQHKPWYQYMTPKIVKRLNKWAGNDFDLGYNKL